MAMIEQGVPPHTMGVVDPIDALPGGIVQRQAVFDAVRPAPRRFDPPRLEADAVLVGKIELVVIEVEEHLQFVINFSHISSYSIYRSERA